MAPRTPDKISRAEMKAALVRSGYLLESRVESTLRQHGGYIEANCTYPDPETGKSREFDLMAMMARNAGPDEFDFLFIVLLIECINNPQPFVILTKEPLVGFLYHEEVKMAGLPVKIPGGGDHVQWTQLSEFLGMEKYHHYCRARVGTQFCSFVKKKSGGGWMATHDDSHYDALQKLCDVVDYYGEKHFKSWSFGDREHLNVEMYYPLVVLQGDLFDGRETKRSVTLRATDHLQFHRSVSRKGKETDYQIDVIRERFLPKYLELVNSEIEKSARLLRRRHKIVRLGIDKIVAEARKATTPEQQRNAMELL